MMEISPALSVENTLYRNLTWDAEKIIQPLGIKKELMEHQKTNICAMLKMENDGYVICNGTIKIKTKMGVLGDKVGSGKSLTIISLLSLKKNPPQNPVLLSNFKLFEITNEMVARSHTNLLIVPDKILFQWVKFFEDVENLNFVVFKNSKVNVGICDHDVIIISDKKYNEFINDKKNIVWSRIIIDEADTIGVLKSAEFTADFVWLVSGTPDNIINNLFSFIVNFNSYYFPNNTAHSGLGKRLCNKVGHIINNLTINSSDLYLESSINLPKLKRFHIICKDSIELKILKNYLPENIISMINAGDVLNAVSAFGCDVVDGKNTFELITDKFANDIKNKTQLVNFLTENPANQTNFLNIKTISKEIERLETKLCEIKKRLDEIKNECCPICMMDFNENNETDNIDEYITKNDSLYPVIMDCCNQIMCIKCIINVTTVKNNCPFCRTIITKKNIKFINNNNLLKTKTKAKPKTKKEELLNLINEKKQSKILLFTTYEGAISNIEIILLENNIKFKILGGSTKNVKNIITEFSEGLINVLVIDVKYFGAGLNLQMATDVILYHRFDRFHEEQAIGRAQRIGRTEPLNVYYLSHESEGMP